MAPKIFLVHPDTFGLPNHGFPALSLSPSPGDYILVDPVRVVKPKTTRAVADTWKTTAPGQPPVVANGTPAAGWATFRLNAGVYHVAVADAPAIPAVAGTPDIHHPAVTNTTPGYTSPPTFRSENHYVDKYTMILVNSPGGTLAAGLRKDVVGAYAGYDAGIIPGYNPNIVAYTQQWDGTIPVDNRAYINSILGARQGKTTGGKATTVYVSISQGATFRARADNWVQIEVPGVWNPPVTTVVREAWVEKGTPGSPYVPPQPQYPLAYKKDNGPEIPFGSSGITGLAEADDGVLVVPSGGTYSIKAQGAVAVRDLLSLINGTRKIYKIDQAGNPGLVGTLRYGDSSLAAASTFPGDTAVVNNAVVGEESPHINEVHVWSGTKWEPSSLRLGLNERTGWHSA